MKKVEILEKIEKIKNKLISNFDEVEKKLSEADEKNFEKFEEKLSMFEETQVGSLSWGVSVAHVELDELENLLRSKN